MILMIHPQTADLVAFHKGEGRQAIDAWLDGYNPVGPKSRAILERRFPRPNVRKTEEAA